MNPRSPRPGQRPETVFLARTLIRLLDILLTKPEAIRARLVAWGKASHPSQSDPGRWSLGRLFPHSSRSQRCPQFLARLQYGKWATTPVMPADGDPPALPVSSEVAAGDGLYPLWLRPPFPAAEPPLVTGFESRIDYARTGPPLRNTAFDRALRYLTFCQEEMADTGLVEHLSSCLPCSLRLLENAGIPEAVELSPLLDRLDAAAPAAADDFEFDHVAVPVSAQCAAGGTGAAGEQLVFEDRGAAEGAAAVVDLACSYDYGSARNHTTIITVDTDATGAYVDARVAGADQAGATILGFGGLQESAILCCNVLPSAIPGPGRVLASFRVEVPDDDSYWRLRLFTKDWVLLDSGVRFSVLLAAGDYVVELLAEDGRRADHALHVITDAERPDGLYDIQ